MRKILLVDICGTIYKENTTFFFLDKYYPSFFSVIRKNIFVKVLNKLALILFKFDLIKFLSLKSLKNKKKTELYEKSQDMVKNQLTKNEVILNFIYEKQKDGYEIKLVSATIDPISKAISREFNYPYISSTLAYRNNFCLGKLKEDLLLIKKERVECDIKSYDIIEMITDNKTDLALCKICTSFFGVSTNEVNKDFWIKNGAKSVFKL